MNFCMRPNDYGEICVILNLYKIFVLLITLFTSQLDEIFHYTTTYRFLAAFGAE